MLPIIIGLFILGVGLLSLELVVPGGILGLLGVVSVLAAWTLAFVDYGIQGGLIAVLAGFLVIGLVLLTELKLLPRTAVGKRLFLEGAIAGTSQRPVGEADLAGKEGTAMTTLSPTGVVEVDGRRYEAFSMSGMVERGTRLQVVDVDNFRVRVKRI